MLNEISTLTCVTRSVSLTIGTDALSRTRIDCGSAIRLLSSSTSSVRNGNFSQRPITTKSKMRVQMNYASCNGLCSSYQYHLSANTIQFETIRRLRLASSATTTAQRSQCEQLHPFASDVRPPLGSCVRRTVRSPGASCKWS